MSTGHSVEFQPSGRGKAKCAANPHYPEGIAVDVSTTTAVLLTHAIFKAGCDAAVVERKQAQWSK